MGDTVVHNERWLLIREDGKLYLATKKNPEIRIEIDKEDLRQLSSIVDIGGENV
jgi:hypothetical protein